MNRLEVKMLISLAALIDWLMLNADVTLLGFWLVVNGGVALYVSQNSRFRKLGVTSGRVPVALMIWTEERFNFGNILFLSSAIVLMMFALIMVVFFPLVVFGLIARSSS